MNNKIKEIWDKAAKAHSGDSWAEQTAFLNEFANLIIKETLDVARAGIEYGNGMEDAVYKYFGVEERQGWVCDKCGTDRTRAVCPLGHMAAIEGKCPMIAEAQ